MFRTVKEECAWRIDADEKHLGFYCRSDQPGVKGNSRRGCEYEPATLPYNVCRSAVDTLQSKIAKLRPLPQILTQRGDWKKQKRAKKQAQFIEGEFYRQRVYEQHAPMIVRDALIFGRGFLKVWTEGRRIKVERAHPWELFADEWDARYGNPRNLYHCRSVDKGILLETYARTESGAWNKRIRDAIDTAGRFDLDDSWDDEGRSTVDRIDIIEAWHLCDRPEEHVQGEDVDDEPADDEDEKPTGRKRAQGEQPKKHRCTGRHVVATTAGTLIDEPWEYDYFPYVVLHYNEAVVGVWGHGLVEQLEGYQHEINCSSERLAEMFHLSGVHIMVPDTAKIHDQQIRNGISITRHAAGGEVKVHQMDLVNEHVRARPRELTEDALNDAGLSQMSVQSQKPNVESGVAIQTLDDIETQRFMMFGRAFETWNVELGRRFIDCAKQIADAYGDHAVSVPMKGGILKLRWSDVVVEGVELRAFPTSLLPTQPAARLDRLVMLWERQVPGFDSDQLLRHLESPDIQGAIDEQLSAKLIVDEMLDAMLDAEEEEGAAAYMAPTAYQPFEWAAMRAQQKLNRAMLDKCPEFNLDLLRQYIEHCQVEQKKLTPPAPAPPMGPGMPANDQMMPGGGVAPVPPATPMAA